MPIGIRLSIVIEIPDSENDSMGNLKTKINENVKKYLGKDFVKIGGAEVVVIHGGGGKRLINHEYNELEKEIGKTQDMVDSLECKLADTDRSMMEYSWEDE
ncbi:hypothetical protein KA005_08150 [bacterium]|nr:hypothetical protein [bacterium]